MKNFLQRLTSRKFLLTVGAALTAYGNGDDRAALLMVAAYVGINGLADVVAVFVKNKYAEPAKLVQQTSLIQSGDLEDATSKVIVPGHM